MNCLTLYHLLISLKTRNQIVPSKSSYNYIKPVVHKGVKGTFLNLGIDLQMYLVLMIHVHVLNCGSKNSFYNKKI